jgi:hypothetical protein
VGEEGSELVDLGGEAPGEDREEDRVEGGEEGKEDGEDGGEGGEREGQVGGVDVDVSGLWLACLHRLGAWLLDLLTLRGP